MADSKNQCCLRAKAKWEITDFTRCSSKQSNNLKIIDICIKQVRMIL